MDAAMTSSDSTVDLIPFRQRLMAACAKATRAEIEASLAEFSSLPAAVNLRKPETGLVMLRGRIGGDGAPFNVGEATVSRATVALDTGEIGHGYQFGRDVEKARLAAIVDALAQKPDAVGILVDALLQPVERRVAGEQDRKARQTAATRVNFFTMVRGED